MIARYSTLLRRCCGSNTAISSLSHPIRSLSSNQDQFCTHTTRCQRDMEKLGERLARDRRAGDVLFLYGDLGCGKTCLARGFVRAYTKKPTLSVTSPTYLLVNTYDEAMELPTVYHVDLYRLETVTEHDVAALGLAKAFERGVTLLEWPERLEKKSMPVERLDVRIIYDEEDTEIRHVEFQPVGERWLKCFAQDN